MTTAPIGKRLQSELDEILATSSIEEEPPMIDLLGCYFALLGIGAVLYVVTRIVIMWMDNEQKENN